MKQKNLSLVLAVMLTLTLLTGCGAKSASAPMAPPMPEESTSMENGAAMDMAGGAVTVGKGQPQPRTDAAKRIYTATLELETTDFDTAAQAIGKLVDQMGGWFESSSVNNRSSGYRYGNYTVRVPAEKFDAFCNQAGELCHLIYSDSNTEDVSEYYYDTAGRLDTQKIKLERLQTLLAKAETMEDIITVESAISETEAAIESLSGELRHYDALVDYSTVSLNLSEVAQLSNVEQPAVGFTGRMATAFSSGWKGFVSGMESLAVALAYGWMWILLLAVIAAAAVRALRNRRKPLAEPPKMPKIKLKDDPEGEKKE